MKIFRATIYSLCLLIGFAPSLVMAQSAPATLPYHTVFGRIGATVGDTGPGQAIPFTTLKTQLGVGAYQYVSILDYGADPTGAVDSAPAVRSAIGSVGYGTTLVVPPGTYLMNSCANSAVLDFSSFGNKGLALVGTGWTMKTGGVYTAPLGSIFKLGTGIADTCDFLSMAGDDAVIGGLQIRDLAIVPAAGTFDAGVGRHAVYINGTNPNYYHTNLTIDHVFIGNMKTGYSIKIAGNNTTPFAGAVAFSTIRNSQLMSINGSFIGDGVKIEGNTFGQNATLDSRNVGIQFSQVSGATSTVIAKNVISNFNGMIVVDGAETPVIINNELEMGNVANTNGALIDLNGSVAAVNGAVITGNSISQNSTVANYAPIKVGTATNVRIEDNTIRIPSTYDFVTVNAGASSGVHVGFNRCTANGVNDLGCGIASVGPNGSQETPYSIIKPGLTSGRVVVNTQSVMGTPTLSWPTASGTLVSTATSPLAINSTTGNVSFGTIATNTVLGNATSGSAIPTALPVGTCSTSASALNWTTNTGFGCNTAVNAAQLGGATFAAPGAIGSGTPGTGAFTTLTSGAHTITSASSNALAVGLAGTTNPALQVDASIASSATGVKVASRAAGAGVDITAISSGTNEGMAINAKGTGVINIGGVSTGLVTIAPNVAHSGTTALSGALTYGGVTLNNAVTGTGNMVLSTNGVLTTPNLGTPSALVGTNITGTGASFTAGAATSATNATNTAITEDTTTNAPVFPTWVTANTGNLPQKTTSTKLAFNPSTGALSATSFSGSASGLTAVPATQLSGIVPAANGGAGTVNGALAGNGSGTVSQAASTQLSDTTAATTWTPTDTSGAALSFTSVTGNFSKINKTCVGNFRLTFPVTADTSNVQISLPCTLANVNSPAAGLCFSTAGSPNGTLVILGLQNASNSQFVNLTGAAAQTRNVDLSAKVLTCAFTFITT